MHVHLDELKVPYLEIPMMNNNNYHSIIISEPIISSVYPPFYHTITQNAKIKFMDKQSQLHHIVSSTDEHHAVQLLL